MDHRAHSYERLDGGALGKGSKFRENLEVSGQKIDAELEITAFDPPHRAESRTEIRGIDVISTYELTPSGSGTRLTQTIEATGGGLKGRVLIPVIQPHLEKKLDADLAALAALLAERRGLRSGREAVIFARMAAAPVPERAPAVAHGQDEAEYFLGELRDIRAEIVRLDGLLQRILAAGQPGLDAALADELRQVRLPDAARLAARVDAVEQSSESLKAERGDESATRSMCCSTPPTIGRPPMRPSALPRKPPRRPPTSRARSCRRRVSRCRHVARHLGQMHIGEALDFEREFADELPEPAQRAEILGWLARHPLAVDGVVDLDKGLIWRASGNARHPAGDLARAGPHGRGGGRRPLGAELPGGDWPFADERKVLAARVPRRDAGRDPRALPGSS